MNLDILMEYAYGHIRLLVKMIGDSCNGEDKPILRVAVIYFMKLNTYINEVIGILIDQIVNPDAPATSKKDIEKSKKRELADLAIEARKETDFEVY